MTKAGASRQVIIIGGGLAGVTALYELASRGVEACLLEKNNGLALETSYANGGMLTASMSAPWNNPGICRHLFASLFDANSATKLHASVIPSLFSWGLKFLQNSTASHHTLATIVNYKLARFSCNRLHELWHTHDLSFERAARGILRIFPSRQDASDSIRIAHLLAPFGLKCELLDSDQAVDIEPELASIKHRIGAAIFYPDDFVGDAHLFVKALAEKACEAGAKIKVGAKVSAIKVENDRVAAVEGNFGTIQAQCVVVASGNASAKLVKEVGIHLPIKPVKGYSITYKLLKGPPQPHVPVIDESMHAAVVPFNGRIRAVGTAEFIGDDLSITPARVSMLKELVRRLYPLLTERINLDDGVPWAGLRPVSANGIPFVGETRIKNLWVTSGHGHLGWTMASGSAALLAQMIMGEETSIDTSPYRIQR